ncbi:MAG: hypothetical protein U0938_05325 [Thiobacillus sp.]|nr:hypothetical protein [Thiobacillus sp.]
MNDFDDYDDGFDEIMVSRLSGAGLPEMRLDAYRSWIADVAPPTDSQIEAFADYAASARSWYKHLPLNPPGALFQLYIDPHAGMDRVVLASGEISMLERTDETEAFHYSWRTTADYRERFGCLAFACGKGSALFQDAMLGDEPVLVDGNCLYPELRISKAVAERPPEEILETGACGLTALVHPHATVDFLTSQLASRKRSVPERGEGESGTWAAILEWWRKGQEVRNAKGEPAYQVGDDPVLAALVEQEKARQHRAMVEAMQRMRSVAFPGASPQKAERKDRQ